MVSSEYRHQGFATTIFLDLLKSARDQGITHCTASFSTSNKAVWRLLRSAEQAGLIHHVTKIYGSETEAIIMLRDQQPEQLSADQRAASNLPVPPEHATHLDSQTAV